MSVDNQSRIAFGRRGRVAAVPILPAADAVADTGSRSPIVGVVALGGAFLAIAGFLVWALAGIAGLNGESAQAEQRVVAIVNQPVTHLPRSGPIELFAPGWFHDGATKPDFDTVDIRATQQFPYNVYGYVSSDLNPTEMFIGGELEFNSMTKYFYTDRTRPKKRLTEAEMDQINGLYRVIGRTGRELFTRWLIAAALVVAGFCIGLALLPLLGRARESLPD